MKIHLSLSLSSMISLRQNLSRLSAHSLSQFPFPLNFHSNPLFQNPIFSPNPNSIPNPRFQYPYPSPKTSSTHFNSPLIPPQTDPISTDYDQDTVLQTLASYNNDWRRALDFFDWVETECGFVHTTETCNRMIDVLGKFFEFDICWDLIEKMRKGSGFSTPDHVTFRVVFKRYASAHLVDEAISTFYKLGEFNLKDELSFSNLIDALCEYKHVVEAEDICLGKNMDKDLVFINGNNTKIFNIILRGWLKMGWWCKCKEFWEEMDRRGVCKDLHSYSIYMDIQCKRGKPWKAVSLYKEMKKKGIKLDVVAYNTVINAIGRSEGVDFATRLFREMKELGHEPNVVTYNTIIKLLCENGRVKEARKMLDDMSLKGCLPNVITYHSILGYLEKPKEILKLFDRMMSSGVRPRIDTYLMLMRKFGRWGFLRPVIEVWDKMLEHGISPDEHAYNALIDVLVEKGEIDKARNYDKEMMEKGLSGKPRVALELSNQL